MLGIPLSYDSELGVGAIEAASKNMVCEYYLIEYLPTIGGTVTVAIGVILIGTGSDGRAFQGCRFRQDWTPVLNLEPNADLEALQALAGEIREKIEGPTGPDFLKQLLDSMSNTLQISGPHRCDGFADAHQLSRLTGIHLSE